MILYRCIVSRTQRDFGLKSGIFYTPPCHRQYFTSPLTGREYCRNSRSCLEWENENDSEKGLITITFNHLDTTAALMDRQTDGQTDRQMDMFS